MDLDISHGGYSEKAIRKWIIQECLESGDPDNFFWVIKDAVDSIDKDSKGETFWEDRWDEK